MNNSFDFLKSEIINAVSSSPGVQGFVLFNLEDDKNPVALKTNLERSIFIIETDKGLVVKISIIIKHEINVKTIIKSVDQSISQVFKNSEYKLNNTDIYIRGVKI